MTGRNENRPELAGLGGGKTNDTQTKFSTSAAQCAIRSLRAAADAISVWLWSIEYALAERQHWGQQ